MKRIIKKMISVADHRGLLNWIPDKQYLQLCYWKAFDRSLDLDNPKTYNEKLQWLKLYDRKPEYSLLVDKYEVKEYVKNKIGEQYIIPTLGVWNSFDEIDFKTLPDQFVLKCTHDSGGLVICKNKQLLDYRAAKKKINKSLKKNYFYEGREWPYKAVKPRIIAEQYMEDSEDKELRDYKFFAFDGVVRSVFIATDRSNPNEETKFDFFDMDFNHLPFTNGHPNATKLPHKPKCFDEMKELAAVLSKGIPQLRVDFYEVDGKVYFGEMTFSHWSGMKPFVPEAWDTIFGDWIKLPNKNK